VKKNGILEIIETKENLESIGGLDVLKEWLLKRRHAFSQRAIEYGLPTPKGLLIIGIPGTGKSLSAKATAKVFGVPLLKLDAERIFAGLVGQSESNLRAVIQTAEAIAIPAVLTFDPGVVPCACSFGTGVGCRRNSHIGGESPRFAKSLPAPEFDMWIETLLIGVVVVLLLRDSF